VEKGAPYRADHPSGGRTKPLSRAVAEGMTHKMVKEVKERRERIGKYFLCCSVPAAVPAVAEVPSKRVELIKLLSTL
jgi:hypothetical protein